MLQHFYYKRTFKRGRLTVAREYHCRVSGAPFTEQELRAWGAQHGHMVTTCHWVYAPETKYYSVMVLSDAERRRRAAK